MTTHNSVTISDHSTSFVGPEAVRLMAAMSLKHALRLYAKCGMKMTRHMTPTVMLQMATNLTGHKYKRGAYAEAEKDVSDWIETMKAAMPITDERTKA